jgi:hypothetical protein
VTISMVWDWHTVEMMITASVMKGSPIGTHYPTWILFFWLFAYAHGFSYLANSCNNTHRREGDQLVFDVTCVSRCYSCPIVNNWWHNNTDIHFLVVCCILFWTAYRLGNYYVTWIFSDI